MCKSEKEEREEVRTEEEEDGVDGGKDAIRKNEKKYVQTGGRIGRVRRGTEAEKGRRSSLNYRAGKQRERKMKLGRKGEELGRKWNDREKEDKREEKKVGRGE